MRARERGLVGLLTGHGFDARPGIHVNVGLGGGALQRLLSHAGAALDAAIGGLAVQLDGVAAEKGRFFEQRNPHPPTGKGVGDRQSGHTGTDHGDVLLGSVHVVSPACCDGLNSGSVNIDGRGVAHARCLCSRRQPDWGAGRLTSIRLTVSADGCCR